MSEQLEFHLPFESPAEHHSAAFASVSDDPGLLAVIRAKIDEYRLLAVMRAKLQEFRTNGIKLPPKDAFMEAGKAAFKRYVTDYNFPQIPDIFETRFDEAATAAFIVLASAAYDAIAGRAS